MSGWRRINGSSSQGCEDNRCVRPETRRTSPSLTDKRCVSSFVRVRKPHVTRLSSQVLSMQYQMCDMMKEIDKEGDMCRAQIENKTTGKDPRCCLPSPSRHLLPLKWHNKLLRQQKVLKTTLRPSVVTPLMGCLFP